MQVLLVGLVLLKETLCLLDTILHNFFCHLSLVELLSRYWFRFLIGRGSRQYKQIHAVSSRFTQKKCATRESSSIDPKMIDIWRNFRVFISCFRISIAIITSDFCNSK